MQNIEEHKHFIPYFYYSQTKYVLFKQSLTKTIKVLGFEM